MLKAVRARRQMLGLDVAEKLFRGFRLSFKNPLQLGSRDTMRLAVHARGQREWG